MKKIGYEGWYEFYLDESWHELTKEEREKFNINPSIINYLVNYTYGREFFVNYDGFSKNKDDLDNFFNLCKNTLIKHNFKILDEEKFVGRSTVTNEKMEAYKLMSLLPNGITQVSYFMRLSGETPDGYVYGCLTTTVKENHDSNEAIIVEAITNWKYL